MSKENRIKLLWNAHLLTYHTSNSSIICLQANNKNMFKFLVMYSNVQKCIAEKDYQTSQQRLPNSKQVNIQ